MPPFGIRAIEKGLEVEGVWNSRTTTPLQEPSFRSQSSSPSLKTGSRVQRSNRNSSVSSLSPSEVPSSVYPPPRKSHTSTMSAMQGLAPPREHQEQCLARGNQPKGAVDPGRDPGDEPTRNVSDKQPGKFFRARGIIMQLPANIDIMDIVYGQPPLSQTANKSPISEPAIPAAIHSEQGKTRRTRRLIIGGHWDISVPIPDPASSSKTTDALERMHAHRRLHAAEMGQLLPRCCQSTYGEPKQIMPPASFHATTPCAGMMSLTQPVMPVELERRSPEPAIKTPETAIAPGTTAAYPRPNVHLRKYPPTAWSERVQEQMEKTRRPENRLQGTRQLQPEEKTARPNPSSLDKGGKENKGSSECPVGLVDSLSLHDKATTKSNSVHEVNSAAAASPAPVSDFGGGILLPDQAVAERSAHEARNYSRTGQCRGRRLQKSREKYGSRGDEGDDDEGRRQRRRPMSRSTSSSSSRHDDNDRHPMVEPEASRQVDWI